MAETAVATDEKARRQRLGQHLRQLREARGLSVHELAGRIRYNVFDILQVEAGEQQHLKCASFVHRLSIALGVTADQVLFLPDESRPPSPVLPRWMTPAPPTPAPAVSPSQPLPTAATIIDNPAPAAEEEPMPMTVLARKPASPPGQLLSLSENRRLDELEATIEEGVQQFVAVGAALLEIRDKRLYREAFSTFETYCKERWGFTRGRGYQLIQAFRGAEKAKTAGLPAPKTEREARERGKIGKPKASARWLGAGTDDGPMPPRTFSKAKADQIKELVQQIRTLHRGHREHTSLDGTLNIYLDLLRSGTAPD